MNRREIWQAIIWFGLIIVMLGILGKVYGQEAKPVAPEPRKEIALNAEQQKRVADLWKDAELAGAKLEAAQKEVQNVQLQYSLALRQFMDDLDLSAKEWEFDNAKRLFRRKEKKQ